MYQDVPERCWQLLEFLFRNGGLGDFGVDLGQLELGKFIDVEISVASRAFSNPEWDPDRRENGPRTIHLIEFGIEDENSHKVEWKYYDHKQLPYRPGYQRVRLTKYGAKALEWRRVSNGGDHDASPVAFSSSSRPTPLDLSTPSILFCPHPIQLQAVRIAKRFMRGFRPTRIAGKPLPPDSIFSGIRFDSVPAFVLAAEIGHDLNREDLLNELCQRGYLRKHEGYPKCIYPQMEYVTEDGTKVYVHDEDWCEIDVLPLNATHFRHHVGGFSGRITLRGQSPAAANAKPSKLAGRAPRVKRQGGSAVQGSSYELLPEGFKLIDEFDEPPVPVTLTRRKRGGEGPGRNLRRPQKPAWARLQLKHSIDGSDHTAELDGKKFRIRGEAAFKMLEVLQQKKGDRVKALVLKKTIGQRPDRVFGLLNKRLQRIIDPPQNGVGYSML